MNRINKNFESALEKLARILAKRYDLNVVIRGSQAMTDGKTIYLPVLEDVTEELYEDLNGFVDHEVAHCKYTDFPEIGKCLNGFHRNLLNAVEDSRIEIELPKEYRGCRLNLERLNAKWQAKVEANRSKLPWPVRLILAIREVYDNKTPNVDAQIQPLFDAIKDKAEALPSCKNTKELRIATEEIIHAINAKRKELFSESDSEVDDMSGMEGYASEPSVELSDDEGEERKMDRDILDPATKEKGEGKDIEGEETASEAEDESETVKGGKGKGEGEKTEEKPSEASGDGEVEKGEGSKGMESGEADGDPTSKTDAKSSGKKELETRRNYAKWSETEEERLMAESMDSDSLFEEHVFSPETYMNDKIEAEVKTELSSETHRGKSMYMDSEGRITSAVSLPVSTEFDTVQDFSGKGNSVEYGIAKKEVMKHIAPMKQKLERVLKAREDKRWVGERERGYLNHRSLSRLATDKAYRVPFKQFTQTDTSNVAVTLVVDCSGSMAGSRIAVARQTAIALGESLKALGIAFEVVGFNTRGERRLHDLTRGLSMDEANRFNRFDEALNHYVFKSFEEQSLTGVMEAKAGGANADGESITWASKRLAQRPEKRKILMVLSDGQPSYGGANHQALAGDLKRVIGMLPKVGIEPIGVGILTDYPKDFYPNNVVVGDLNQLSTTVVGKISMMLATDNKQNRRVA